MNKSVSIHRAPKTPDQPYMLLARALAQHRGLPFDVRGLLVYVLSKPTDWEVNPHDLAKEGDIGLHRVYRMLKDGIRYGYIQRIVERSEDGRRIAAFHYEIHETPLFGGFLQVGNQFIENCPTTEKRIKQSKEIPASSAKAGDGIVADIAPKTVRPRKVDPIFDAISAAFSTSNGGVVSAYRALLVGDVKGRGAWLQCQLQQPMDAVEIAAFGEYRRTRAAREKIAPASTPETLARWVEEFRALRIAQANGTASYVSERGVVDRTMDAIATLNILNMSGGQS